MASSNTSSLRARGAVHVVGGDDYGNNCVSSLLFEFLLIPGSLDPPFLFLGPWKVEETDIAVSVVVWSCLHPFHCFGNFTCWEPSKAITMQHLLQVCYRHPLPPHDVWLHEQKGANGIRFGHGGGSFGVFLTQFACDVRDSVDFLQHCLCVGPT